jgi:membrane-bound lytic murein transglycosylase MltF
VRYIENIRRYYDVLLHFNANKLEALEPAETVPTEQPTPAAL